MITKSACAIPQYVQRMKQRRAWLAHKLYSPACDHLHCQNQGISNIWYQLFQQQWPGKYRSAKVKIVTQAYLQWYAVAATSEQ